MEQKDRSFNRLATMNLVAAMFLVFALIFCLLWRIEIKEKKKIEISLKISENTKNFWAGKAIELDNMLRQKLQVGLSDNRPIDFETKLEEKLQNCK